MIDAALEQDAPQAARQGGRLDRRRARHERTRHGGPATARAPAPRPSDSATSAAALADRPARLDRLLPAAVLGRAPRSPRSSRPCGTSSPRRARRTTSPSSSTASSIDRAMSTRGRLAVPLDQRRQLVPPAGREPAVATRTGRRRRCRPRAARSGRRARSRSAGTRPTARCSRRPGSRRRRSWSRATAGRPRPGAAPAAASAASASRSHHDRRAPLGRTPPSIAVSCLPAGGRSATRSSTVTGFGTSPSSVMNAIDSVQPASSMAPEARRLLDRAGPRVDRRGEDGGLRVAASPRAPGRPRSPPRGPRSGRP